MDLNLKNPLVFFDLETTGMNIARDRIVEISILKIHPNGKEEKKTWRVNPQMPIEPSATAVHGISLEDLKDAPTFNELAKNLARELEGCDLAGFNLNKFDLPLLVEEFLRAGVEFLPHKRRIIDVHVIFQKMEQRTLSAAYRFYCQKELTNAHSAEADTLATYEVLKAQLDRYEGTTFKDQAGTVSTPVINDMDQLSKFSSHTNNADYAGRIVFDDKGNECFNFGKYKGMKVEEVFEKDPSYYSWMQNGDFPLYTKNLLTAIKLRKMKK
ncbi:MAG: exonuclease domain-containing protein [Bacteroidales bacterium]